ncbi:hypothetical protein IAE22_36115, partial [Bacillus sp. S34]|nr:hypothetical protein [Bacillus sp. S34]
GEGHLELGGLGRPQFGRGAAQREVDREQAGEEHDLAAQPHDRPHGNGVRPVEDRTAGGSGERGASHVLHYGGSHG